MPQLGVVHSVVVCVPASSGTRGPCPAGQVQSVTQAYLISPASSSAFDLMAEPFDAATAGAFFGYAFASTVALWMFALGVGKVINMIKSA